MGRWICTGRQPAGPRFLDLQLSLAAVTYNADNWDLTAHVIYGTTGDKLRAEPTNGLKDHPDYVNLDLTATKTLGKWEVGAVAFGSWDVSSVSEPFGVTYAKQAQFALGGSRWLQLHRHQRTGLPDP